MAHLKTAALLALLSLLCLCCPLPTQAAATTLPADLQAAQDSLDQHLALGHSLAGRPATPQQVADANRLLDHGLARARAYLAQHDPSPEAHHLLGLLLTMAYRPVERKTISTDPETGKLREQITTLLRQGGKQAEDGLPELRTALQMKPKDFDCQLDYAEALLICSQPDDSAKQALATWEERASLTPSQRLRTARLLAAAMQKLDDPEQEERWLREVLRQNRGDPAATKRLAELAASAPKEITWHNYEEGIPLSAQQRKPVLMDFGAAWCGWCRKLEAEVFPDPAVISLSRQFICIWVDADRRADLKARYAVRGLPTVVFLDPQGRELNRIVGFRPAPQFLAEMRRALGQ